MRNIPSVLLSLIAVLCIRVDTTAAVSRTADDGTYPVDQIAAFRSEGPAGLAKFFALNAEVLTNHQKRVESGVLRDQDAQWLAFCAVADAVARQKDAAYSNLYWYTDLNAAMHEARAQGKPILSLRMLGNLDTELSCANSRFFRTALYANAQVSDYLREHYILCWQSVRPVPVMTIDFGDGRTVKRTIAGNSIHWILDPQGRPIDALPGLYGPGAFLRELKAAEAVAKSLSSPNGSSEAERESILGNYHRQAIADIDRQVAHDQMMLGVRSSVPVKTQPSPPGIVAASLLTTSKIRVERPAIRLITGDELPPDANAEIDETSIATLHADDAKLDASSIALISEKRPDQAALPGLVEGFQRSITSDTVHDEYILHRTIHQWLASGSPEDVDRLNDRVYSELFLTPSSDPWLGMGMGDAYSAIADDGVSGK